MEAGMVVRVIKDFLTTIEGELCVSAGCYLQVVSVADRYWVDCCLETRQGMIPSANVTPVDIPPLKQGHGIAVASADYRATAQGQKQLNRGELLITLGEEVPGWLKGYTLSSPDSVGLFPSSGCWQLDSSYYQAHHTNVRKGRNVEKYAKVVQSMQAQLSDELSLKQGQIVKITHIIDKDWYRGECEGACGIFPASFVKIIDSFPGDKPSNTADITPYLRAGDSSHEYSNTRPAFKGLDEGLRAAFGCTTPAPTTLLSHGAKLHTMLEPSLNPHPPLSSQTSQSSQSSLTSQSSPHPSLLDSTHDAASLLDDDYFRQNLPASFAGNAPSSQADVLQRYPKLSDPSIQSEGYNNLSANLSVLKQDSSSSTLASLTTPVQEQPAHNLALLSDIKFQDIGIGSRYQNVGYSGENIHVRPYGVTLYAFCAQFENELSFREGEVVYLLRYVDAEWMEGELDCQVGIFPISYINIIVDCEVRHQSPFLLPEDLNYPPGCDDAGEQPNSLQDQKSLPEAPGCPQKQPEPLQQDNPGLLPKHRESLEESPGFLPTQPHAHRETHCQPPACYYIVAYNFAAQLDSDLQVSEGEIVKLITQQDSNWCFVENESGGTGTVPLNHLHPYPSTEVPIIEEMDRLLQYSRTCHPAPEQLDNKNVRNPELKFFDPLCSPDEQMMKLEAELEKKARDVPQVPVNPHVTIHRNIRLSPLEEPNKHKQRSFKSSVPCSEASIDTFISANLSGLDSNLVGKTNSLPPLPYKTVPSASPAKFFVSDSVLTELKGKQPKAPKPPRPSQGPTFQAKENLPSSIPGAIAVSQPDIINKPQELPRNAPKEAVIFPPIPSPPTEDIYATVNKADHKKPHNDCKVDMSARSTQKNDGPTIDPSPSPKEIGHPLGASDADSSPATCHDPPVIDADPSPPSRPQRVKKQQSLPSPHEPFVENKNKQTDVDASSCCTVYDYIPADACRSQTVSAEIHHYDNTEELKDICTASCNDISSSSHGASSNVSNYPCSTSQTIPEEKTESPSTDYCQHTSSAAVPSSPAVPKRTTSSRPQLCVSRGDTFKSYISSHTEFPPDKRSPMSPDSAEDGGSVPSRPTSAPLKSRSVFYTGLTSERSTPSLPSPSHSYETLNGSDINNDLISRTPHRPAPPVPVNQAERKDQEQKSRERQEKDRKALRHRKINSLKRQINIKEKMLECDDQEQLLLELDMYQDIAVAKGLTYDTLNKRMDRCQENIETISDDIQRLQACLADEELKLEEENIDELTRREENDRIRAKLEAKRLEQEKRAMEERRQKNREQRENVVGELVVTEREYCRDLKLTFEAFGMDTPTTLEQRGIDVPILFGNLDEIIEVSEGFLDSLQLEVKSKSDPSARKVGCCFLEHAERMKVVYTAYCINHDKAEQLLEKYETLPDIQKFLAKGVEVLRSQVACFNMGSILIKPVQRILKYPLILNELLKCTEDDHEDKADLKESVVIMSDIAAFINETKRKKDIVEKYRDEGESTIGRKIAKLNMHSIGKKSSRMSQKFFTSLGMDSMTKDHEFEELERKFSYLTQSVQMFCGDAQRLKEQLHETILSQFNIAENVADLYNDRGQQREVERFRTAHRNIISTYWNQFSVFVDSRVVGPVQVLLDTFQSPGRLMQKRTDKLMDYSSSEQRNHKNRDANKNKSLQEEMESSKTTYEALNSQLLDELPTLIELATDIYTEAVKQFILARKLFVGRVTKELLQLMDLPLLSTTAGDILEVFLIKHSLVCNHFGRFSFSSKTFRPDDKKTANSSARNIGQDSLTPPPQSCGHRTYLRGKYAATKLYQSNSTFLPSSHFEIGVSPGDLVGVIQQKDPMGNTQRWFCDNGLSQGFIDASILTPLGQASPEHQPASDEMGATKEAESKEQSAGEEESPPPSYTEVTSKPETAKPIAVVAPYDEVAEDECRRPTRKAPPVPGLIFNKPKDQRRETEGSVHSYEEIAASDANSETVSQDLSPIYEEIPGGSRSSSSSGSGRSLGSPRGKFYYAVYEFVPGPEEGTLLRVTRGQVVKVVQVSGEWWYVEDRHSVRGYVPQAYLKPYQNSSSRQTT